MVLTWVGHGRKPGASPGFRLCDTGSLAPAPAGSALQDVVDRSQEVVEEEVDRSEAHWKIEQ